MSIDDMVRKMLPVFAKRVDFSDTARAKEIVYELAEIAISVMGGSSATTAPVRNTPTYAPVTPATVQPEEKPRLLTPCYVCGKTHMSTNDCAKIEQPVEHTAFIIAQTAYQQVDGDVNPKALTAALNAYGEYCPKRELSEIPSEIKYLKEWHDVTQSLMGAVGVYLQRGDLENARARFAYYRAKLPKYQTDIEGQS